MFIMLQLFYYCFTSLIYVIVFFVSSQIRITFDTTEDCYECSRLITLSESSLKRLDDIFAFQYFCQALNQQEQLSTTTSSSSLLATGLPNGTDHQQMSMSTSNSYSGRSKKNQPGSLLLFCFSNQIILTLFDTNSN